MKIYTKQIRNKWYCYSTIECYDQSFEGNTIEEAQAQMKEFLKKRNITNAVFAAPVYYIYHDKPSPSQITNQRMRIDHPLKSQI